MLRTIQVIFLSSLVLFAPPSHFRKKRLKCEKQITADDDDGLKNDDNASNELLASVCLKVIVKIQIDLYSEEL